MTEAVALRSFAVALLEDVGAEVRADGMFLWLRVPEPVQASLDLPARACLTFDSEHVGEFDAELVAPGSYLLEKLLGLATRRGRWDVGRLATPAEGWIGETLRRIPRLSTDEPGPDAPAQTEEPLLLFAFRTALTSDEKREGFHLIAVPMDGAEGWEVPWPLAEEGLVPATLPGTPPDLEPAYRTARETLERGIQDEMGAFRRSALTSLEEEVRRIFRYFDGTVAEMRDAAPSGAEDLVRAIEAERDRRLAEALERFEPHAVASLCSVRIVFVPTIRTRVRVERGETYEVRLDGLTRHIRGLPTRLTGAESVPLLGRPRSGTPRPQRRAARAGTRSPRGSRERSRSAASRRRGS
jgi:hypothetical protein